MSAVDQSSQTRFVLSHGRVNGVAMLKGPSVRLGFGIALISAALLGASPVLAQPAAPAPAPSGAGLSGPPSFSPLVRRVMPSVVSISVKLAQGTSFGSGFIVDPSGLLVTNNHVMQSGEAAEVRFSDGRTLKAKLVGRDAATDIALLRIESPGAPFAAVKFANDRDVRVGDWVIAVGNPLGLHDTVTAGIVSGRGREFSQASRLTDFLQIDAPINSGNSGGPTFDMAGRVVGMNTLVRSSPFGGAADGIAYAIPSSTIQAVSRDLIDGVVNRGFLGVVLEELGEAEAKALGLPNTNGALVSDVVAGSPAEKAGVKRGDVILKVNGQVVKDNQDCLRKIALLRPGQTASLEVWRNSQRLSFNVTIATRTASLEPTEAKDASQQVTMSTMGLQVQTLTDVVAAKLGQAFGAQGGVVIAGVDADSEAAKVGLRPGDVILAVGDRNVASLSDVNLAVEQARALKREYVLLYVQTQLGTKAHAALPVGN